MNKRLISSVVFVALALSAGAALASEEGPIRRARRVDLRQTPVSVDASVTPEVAGRQERTVGALRLQRTDRSAPLALNPVFNSLPTGGDLRFMRGGIALSGHVAPITKAGLKAGYLVQSNEIPALDILTDLKGHELGLRPGSLQFRKVTMSDTRIK